MHKIHFLFLLVIFASCHYGINERTSAIADIDYSCRKVDWDNMRVDHSLANIKDSTIIRIIPAFKTKPFETELFYFDEAPQEIIAISTDHYQIRYVYNSNLSSQVLDGYSRKLDKNEVDRISKRIYSLLEKYGCVENQ